MLHVRFRGRQVRACLAAALLCATLTTMPHDDALASRRDDLATAAELARSGDHAQAAQMYESLSKRLFRGRDTRVTLLAAREYVASGRLGDAERMLGYLGEGVDRDDAVLLAQVQAELALARHQPLAAIAAVDRVPKPWPTPLAVELLGLRAQAEFAAGRMLDGIRTLEARGRYLTSPEERRANYDLLVAALRAHPASATAVPAGATPDEGAWFELAAVLASAQTDPASFSQRASDWTRRHPGHPGTAYLPKAAIEPTTPTRPSAAVITTQADVIGLLLPLTGRLQSAGRAVRDGFLAAALAEPVGGRPRIVVEDTASDGVAASYEKALAAGASAIAGPLAKEDVASLVGARQLPVPTLALNSLPLTSPPPFLFQFALDPEQEARAVARRIAEDGRIRGIALFPDNAWGERLRSAFTEELSTTGVELTSVQFYEPSAADFSAPLRAALGRYGGAGDRPAKGKAPLNRDPVAEARDGPQFAFIAANTGAARALVPQLRYQMTYAVPVYATSDVIDPGSRPTPDLDGVLFPEMPWVIGTGQGAPQLWDLLQTDWAGMARGHLRLYAFGYDSYRLLRTLGAMVRGGGVSGLTGRLTMTDDGRVQRDLDWAQVEDGRPQVAGPSYLPALPVEP
jgi:outer membrane PBP1 activator LpoA protein